MHGRKIAIERFLEVALPEDMVLPDGELRFFVEQDINDLILERKPFFWIDKAVSIGTDFMLTSTLVTAAHCEGHYPGYPVVPLIEIGRVAAQTGFFLVTINMPADQETIAVGSDKFYPKINEFIDTPAILLAKAQKTHYTAGFYFVDIVIYVDQKTVALAKNVVYGTKPKSEILAKVKA